MSVHPRFSPRSRRRAVITTTAAGLVASLCLAQPAVADEASDAPVTKNDRIHVDAGGGAPADVLANDSDPNGDELAICRVEVPEDAPLVVDTFDDQLFVSSYGSRSATYTITYYACDFDYLTPATLTVKVTRAPQIVAEKLARPGRVRFTNPGDRRVVVLYGSRRADEPDGMTRIAASSSGTVSVMRKRLFYIAFVARTGAPAGRGFVEGITVPNKIVTRVAPTTFRTAERTAWAARS